MSMIDDIKWDRDTGTPGRWLTPDYTCDDQFPGWYIVPESCFGTVAKLGPALDVDANRCARVPDMEAALLAADELAAAAAEYVANLVEGEFTSTTREARYEAAAKAYREATQ